MLKNNSYNNLKNVGESALKYQEVKTVGETHIKNDMKEHCRELNVREHSQHYLPEINNLILLQSIFIEQQQRLIDILSEARDQESGKDLNIGGQLSFHQAWRSPAVWIRLSTGRVGDTKPRLKVRSKKAKLARFEKTESEEQELNKLNKHKKFIKIIVSISFALLVFVGITIVVIHYSNKFEEEAEYIPTEPGDGNNNHLGSHQIFDRTKWNGRPPLNYTNITSPVPLVIIKHTGGGPCFTFLVCAGKLQTIQSQCVSNGAPDIYYNFLIGGDGNIYVGRGWDVQPQQRHDIIDIVFMGSFAFDELTPIMIEAAQLLITDGAKKNKLTKDYKVVSHNQTTATESPGTNVFKEVKTWPHYDSGLYFTDKVLAKDETSLN
ncbi:hypothetical protein NQ314_020808 [Rhamnusium bicolor]|uniref:Uncharacterized protein n=1 Tax=Rhamnusium bicolor TaxID=1586634 RepID=A0AAV8WK10_9CUCU|nr:hypothetical protein NQ314_020808 [Rhamnusium bicolor]